MNYEFLILLVYKIKQSFSNYLELKYRKLVCKSPHGEGGGQPLGEWKVLEYYFQTRLITMRCL